LSAGRPERRADAWPRPSNAPELRTLSSVSKTPAVRAKELLVGYGGEPVCAPVSFTLSPGRVVALVGANGSGKSTVLRAVLGLLEPAGGTVEVFGTAVDEREVGFRTQVASVLDDDA
jgi:ABC-type multidrug transport system ATPase subunit